MGKQANIRGSQFGGEWTIEKLTIIDDYLQFYVNALSKQKLELNTEIILSIMFKDVPTDANILVML